MSARHRAVLLDQITVEHGPVDLLGRFFLSAFTAAEKRGVQLALGTFEELLATNDANRNSWLPLFPAFDHRYNQITSERGFCVLGRNATGEVVATHAVRFHDWTATDFHIEAESLRLTYGDPERQKRPGETCKVTAQSARSLTGRVALTGAAWYRPDHRGRQLAEILSRIGRAYGLTRWATDYSACMMSEALIKKGLAAKTGHPHVDWAVDVINSPLGNIKFALVWETASELIDDLAHFTQTFDTELDRAAEHRRA
jgi:hypothetical protein